MDPSNTFVVVAELFVVAVVADVADVAVVADVADVVVVVVVTDVAVAVSGGPTTIHDTYANDIQNSF